MLYDLRCYEWRRARETLRARWQHGATHAIVRQLDVGGVGSRVGGVWRREGVHQHVLRLEVAIDDLTAVQILERASHLQQE